MRRQWNVLMMTAGIFAVLCVSGQEKALVNTSASRHAVLGSINMGEVRWTTTSG